MKNVFQPMNLRTEKAISDGSAYLSHGHLPYRWRLFIRHTEVYQKLINDWKDDDQMKRTDYLDCNANIPAVIYPSDMTACAQALVDQLEQEERNVRWTFIRSITFGDRELQMPDACKRQGNEPEDRVPD
jgi:hypothetical protein